MKSFIINSREKRVLEILEQYKACSANEIARHIGVTSRTVLNYIKNINELIGKDVAEIVFTKNRKYIIQKKNTETFQKILSFNEKNNLTIPEERVKEIIRILLEKKEMIRLEDLAESLYISRTTLVKDLKRVSKIFKKYNIKLKGKPNSGIEVIGTEINMRFCLSQFYFNQKCIMNNRSQKIYNFFKHKELIEKILEKIFKQTGFKVAWEDFENIVLHISIALERYKNGNSIEQFPEKIYIKDKSKEYLISVYIREELKKEIGIELPKEEIMYIYLHLLGRKPVEEMIESEGNIEIKSEVKKLVSMMLDEINRATGFYMKDDEELIWGLELHLNFAINRIIFNMNIRNPLFLEVKKKYPLAYELATIGASVIEKELNVKVDEHEISYIAIHIGSYIERNNYKYKDIQRVALVCGTGLGTAQLMLVKIKKVLGDLQEIKTFSSSTLEPDILEEFDIIFTTIDLDINVSTPIIKLDVLFDEKELENKIAYRKLKYQISKDSYYIFKSLLKRNMFFKISLETPEEIIGYMAQKCIEAGKADKGFKERILERERLSSTAFDNYIAIPHAINYNQNQIDMAVGVLDKTVRWDRKPIKLVFMVLVPNEIVEDINLFLKVYEDILSIGQNKSLIEKIFKVKDFNEFISLF